MSDQPQSLDEASGESEEFERKLLQGGISLREFKARKARLRSLRGAPQGSRQGPDREVFLPDPVLDSQKKAGRKYTEEGYPIFTEEELKINLPGSGNTPLCPFDCDCCF